MTPKRQLRNRKRIKAPRRFEDADIDTSSPRQEAEESSEESPELVEEIYKTPKPKQSKSKQPAYHGKVIEFNPNLPPAAFPTLDHPDYVHNGGTVAIDLESGLQNREPKLADFDAINTGLLDRGSHGEIFDPTEHQPTMTSTTPGFVRQGSPAVMQPSIRVQREPGASVPSTMYGEPTDNGPRNPIWVSNMARMEAAGKMSDLDRIALDMEDSDEGDADARPAKVAKTTSIPEFPAWDDLTAAHKLRLADVLAEPEGEAPVNLTLVMHQLRLSSSQQMELVELLIQRNDRMERENANEQRLQDQTQRILLQGGHLSQAAYHQLVERNIYGAIGEDDHHQSDDTEAKQARAYLRYCGFDPALVAGSWDVPPISNAASETEPEPAQSKTRANISSTAAPAAPSPSEDPPSPRPAMSTRSQQASCVTDSRLGIISKHSQGGLPQHRPVPAYALNAQHSPAVPLSKVPERSFPIKPGNKSDISRDPAPRAIDNALPKSRGASSLLPREREEHSLPTGSHSPVTEDWFQSSGSANAEESAPGGIFGAVANADSVNKKKRKKDAALVGLNF